MASLLRRALNWGGQPAESERSVTWLPESFFTFNGVQYPYGMQTSYGNNYQEAPEPTFSGYASMLYRLNPVLFACAMVRLSLFSEARFQFRQLRSGRPGDLFGNPDLAVLETPWPNGTTGDLLARAIEDADIAGNAYFARRGQYLRRMRPDWVTIVLGSEVAQEPAFEDLDTQVLGYMYQPGGPTSGIEPIALLPEQVCHFAPIPDPMARFRGMSWLHCIVQELMADQAATSHKLKYFEQGATPNMKISVDSPWIKTQEQFDAFVAKFKAQHEGTANAFKSMFLSAGMDAAVIGGNMQQTSFKEVQGAGETRIAAAARTPAVLVGISEGLQGSALNSGNYDSAFRQFADLVMRPLWRNFSGSMAHLVNTPPDAELWYDDRDIPALQNDVKDNADILAQEAITMRQLIDAGFIPDTVTAAVKSGDWSLLKHSGLFSVQLQPPLPEPAPAPTTNGTPPLPIGSGA